MRVIEILLALGEVATTQVRHLVFFLLLALRKVTDMVLSGIRLGVLPSCKIWGGRTLGFLLVVAHLYLIGPLGSDEWWGNLIVLREVNLLPRQRGPSAPIVLRALTQGFQCRP